MKQLKIFIFILFTLCATPTCYPKATELNYEYNISGVSIAKEGYYLLEVSVLVDNKKDTNIEIAKQYALMGCLFKGFIVDRISQKPIISAPIKDNIHEEYINQLITKDYNIYTNSYHPLQIVKVGKKFRVTAIILVAKESLRKNLENNGIIRKLGL